MPLVAAPAHRTSAARVRELVACWEAHRDLVALGAYAAGADPRVDAAIARMPAIERFLRQGVGEATPFEESVAALAELAS
jgi:flagellar biosynthesis/type III secretory pathway ATPase